MPTWPKDTKASTLNVDQGSDQISSARADILQNITNVNTIIDTFDIQPDSAGQPANGDILQYNSTTTTWQPVASTAVGGVSGTLVIPFGGYVVSEWSGSDAGDSAGREERERKFRMVTMGGKYYDTSIKGAQTSSDLSLVSTEQTIFGDILGATVTRATPTLNKPTGYSVSGFNNHSFTITNGIMTVADHGIAIITSFIMNGNIGSFDNDNGPKNYNVQYASGFDNYVTLPAGTYVVSLKSLTTSLNSSYDTETSLESNTDVIAPTNSGADFWIYNKTDDVEITPSNGSNSTLDMVNWEKDVLAVFTLSGTKDIQFFQSADQSINHFGTDGNTPVNQRDYLGFSGGAGVSGDVTASGGNYFFDDASAGTIPAKLGYYDAVANTYIRIDKIST
jgi:hypothetical protein